MDKEKRPLRQYDVDREGITRSILLEVFVADKDNEYGIRELERLTGLAVSTLSKWLHGENNDLASKKETGRWKWHAPVAHDKPFTVAQDREADEAIKYDMHYPKSR